MKTYSKFLLLFCAVFFLLTTLVASRQGWGLPGLRSKQSLEAVSARASCPDWQKDRYGNCMPRTHRRSLGVRHFTGYSRGK